MRIKATAEFEEWLNGITAKGQAQIVSRLHRIEQHGHYGDFKDLGLGLAELRWANGWRVYFTKAIDTNGNLILVLLGGIKNAQKKDIKKARRLIEKYVDE
jgi:putative addiction module killer protein